MNEAVLPVVCEVEVMFGDCDPAGIVLLPNFSNGMDASSLNFFRKCGAPAWRELYKTTGIMGTLLLEINTRLISPATYGRRLRICTTAFRSGPVRCCSGLIKTDSPIGC